VFVAEKFESGLAFFADATGRITRFSREPADLEAAKRLPGQAALPGLVNTHTQAWQRVLRGRVELRPRTDRDTLGNWREAHERVLGKMTAADIYDAAQLAFVEMLLSGITCVGEGHFLHRQADGSPWPEPHLAAREILRAAHDTGIRIALLNGAWARADFGQAAGSGPARCVTATAEQFVRETETLRDYIEKNLPGDEAWIGVAAREFGGVPPEFLKAIGAYARAKRMRFHVQVGESAAERAACVTEFGKPPSALLAESGLLDKRFIAIGGAQLNDDDVRVLGAAKVTVCACAAGELARGEGAVPLGKLLAAGATFALGTDGQLQTNLLEDARLLEFQLRGDRARAAAAKADVAAPFFHAATVAGARSLGAPGGAIEIGRPADFFTVDLYDPSIAGSAPETLLSAVVFASTPRAVREVWVGARQRVGRWRHPLQSAAITRFGELQKRLWS
jgi:formimidoylglutamate deiminase